MSDNLSLLAASLANLVLQDTIERIYAGNLYADVPRGIFLVRGENVLLLGEVVGETLRADLVPYIFHYALFLPYSYFAYRISTGKMIFPLR